MEHPFIEFAILFLLLLIATTTATFALNDDTNNAASGATTRPDKKFGVSLEIGGTAPKTGGGTPKTIAGPPPKMGRKTKTGLTPSPKKGGTSPPVPLLPKEQEFLKAHNDVRYRNGLPPLTWDHKCAAYARWYAKSRSKDCTLKHSTGPFGENIFWGEGNSWTPEQAVEDWLDEHKYYNRELHTCQSGKMCEHYTQIVWRDTQKVGCGHVLCDNGDTYIVCSYDPPGNFQGKLPFVKHNPIMYYAKDRLQKLSLLPKNF